MSPRTISLSLSPTIVSAFQPWRSSSRSFSRELPTSRRISYRGCYHLPYVSRDVLPATVFLARRIASYYISREACNQLSYFPRDILPDTVFFFLFGKPFFLLRMLLYPLRAVLFATTFLLTKPRYSLFCYQVPYIYKACYLILFHSYHIFFLKNCYPYLYRVTSSHCFYKAYCPPVPIKRTKRVINYRISEGQFSSPRPPGDVAQRYSRRHRPPKHWSEQPEVGCRNFDNRII